MAKYIAAVNRLLCREIARTPKLVSFGENIDKGSHISGLTRNLVPAAEGRVINVGNWEAAHCGAGFGMMLEGASSVLFVKQLDFMLLAMDHFASTYNLVRTLQGDYPMGSFSIVAVVCDQGYQGPQSSFNALGSICSLARVPGYCITNASDADRILSRHLVRPGFRFIALSQRLFGTEILEPPLLWGSEDDSILQYARGDDATVVCFNFSFPEGCRIQERLEQAGLSCDVFSAGYPTHPDWRSVLASAGRTGNLVVLDDSKCLDLPAYRLLHEAAAELPACRRLAVVREPDPDFGVCADCLEIDCDQVAAWIGEPRLIPLPASLRAMGRLAAGGSR